jgi:hypothetical protein
VPQIPVFHLANDEILLERESIPILKVPDDYGSFPMLNPRPHTVNISAFEAISISEANNEMTK